MPEISLGQHFDSFVQEQLESGRFQNASEVVRAGLRLLEDQETSLAKRRADLRRKVNEAFDDPRPPIPASEVFARLRAHHADQGEATEQHGG